MINIAHNAKIETIGNVIIEGIDLLGNYDLIIEAIPGTCVIVNAHYPIHLSSNCLFSTKHAAIIDTDSDTGDTGFNLYYFTGESIVTAREYHSWEAPKTPFENCFYVHLINWMKYTCTL
jgi:hypothetical protein